MYIDFHDPITIFLAGFIFATALDLRGFARRMSYRISRWFFRRFSFYNVRWVVRLLFGL